VDDSNEELGQVNAGRLEAEVAVAETTSQLATKRRCFGVPGTWVGWTSVGLTVLALAGIFNRRFIGGFRGVFAGLMLGGAVALVAIVWKKERSILVWIPLAIGVLAAAWTAAELLFLH
jgi:hypothetical protein